MSPMNVAVLLTALVASARCEIFRNGPVTFKSEQSHSYGTKSISTVTLGAAGPINTDAAAGASKAASNAQGTVSFSQPTQVTIAHDATPSVHVVETASPQIGVIHSAPQVSLLHSAAPQVSFLRSGAVIGGVAGYAAAPGSDTASPSGPAGAVSPSPEASVADSQAPPPVADSLAAQAAVGQPRTHAAEPPPSGAVLAAESEQVPVTTVKVERASGPDDRLQLAASGPATSHGYTVNAPGQTTTATFGYPAGGFSFSRPAFRAPARQRAPYAFQAPQAPASRLRLVSAARSEVAQTPAPEVGEQQEVESSSGSEEPQDPASEPATEDTDYAPGDSSATFGQPDAAVDVSQAPAEADAEQVPAVQLSVAQPRTELIQGVPQISIQQAAAPQLHVASAPQPQLQFIQTPVSHISVLQAPAQRISVLQALSPQIGIEAAQGSPSGPEASQGYAVNATGLGEIFAYSNVAVSVPQTGAHVTLTGTPLLQWAAQPQLQYLQAVNPQVHYVQLASPKVSFVHAPPATQVNLLHIPTSRVSLLHAPAPQISLLHQTLNPVSTFTYGAPRISVLKAEQQPQVQAVPAPDPQVSLLKTAQPQVQPAQGQAEDKTIRYEAPRPAPEALPRFTAPNVRRQQFNTPSHGYRVSAPGFTKHKTFSGPSVYGTHQDSGISGASGIGHVDLSVRQSAGSSA